MNAFTPSSELQLRNFEWCDLEQLLGLLVTVGKHGHREWPENVRGLRLELESPRVQPDQNMVLVSTGNDLVGYALVEPEPNISRSVVDLADISGNPEVQFLTELPVTKLLLEWASKHAFEFAPIMHLATRECQSDLASLIEQSGWKRVRQYLKLASPVNPLPATAAVPKGFTVRTMQDLEEVMELTRLQNESFRTHFGYSPNTENEIRSQLEAPNNSIDDVVMLRDSNERLVAYCWTTKSDRLGKTIGRIGMIGVAPDAQARGFGRAIAESGFNHLIKQGVNQIDLDVDSVNTAAIKIYSSLGFTTTDKVDWWENAI
jgi:mycothiol synthase